MKKWEAEVETASGDLELSLSASQMFYPSRNHMHQPFIRVTPRKIYTYLYMCVSVCSIIQPNIFLCRNLLLKCQVLHHIPLLLKSLNWLLTATETESKLPALGDCSLISSSPRSSLSTLQPCCHCFHSSREPSSWQSRARVRAAPSAQSAIPPVPHEGERCPAYIQGLPKCHLFSKAPSTFLAKAARIGTPVTSVSSFPVFTHFARSELTLLVLLVSRFSPLLRRTAPCRPGQYCPCHGCVPKIQNTVQQRVCT